MSKQTLERLRELKSSLTSTTHALTLANRFPDEYGVIFWLKMTMAECELRLKEVKEELSDEN